LILFSFPSFAQAMDEAMWFPLWMDFFLARFLFFYGRLIICVVRRRVMRGCVVKWSASFPARSSMTFQLQCTESAGCP
jgi:hypothetical protein